jgi:intracellular multiplication protein IcmB
LGAATARQVLAKYFPGGSARQEVRRRVVLHTEKGEVESSATSAVIQEMVQELVKFAREDPAKLMAQ